MEPSQQVYVPSKTATVVRPLSYLLIQKAMEKVKETVWYQSLPEEAQATVRVEITEVHTIEKIHNAYESEYGGDVVIVVARDGWGSPPVQFPMEVAIT